MAGGNLPGGIAAQRIVHSVLRAALLLLMSLGLAPAARASDPAALCDAAARQAADATGVPLSVLRAISLSETGRERGGKFRPWPWTVNMEGKGVWFDDATKALDFAERGFDRGARSFDVGCFQINYKWHGGHFTSIAEMFQPGANALYAARFLRDLHAELGDWVQAAGAYHSRTPKYAKRYSRRFRRIRANLKALDPAKMPMHALKMVRAQMAPERPLSRSVDREIAQLNRYPLLQGGDGGRGLGSLVPVTASAGGLFRRVE